MKALFESRFPFVLKDDSELTEGQLKIKKEYEETYFVNDSENNEVMVKDKSRKK